VARARAKAYGSGAVPDVDPLKAFALFAPADLDESAPRELGRDQGVLQGVPRTGERLEERYTLVESLGQGGMGLVFRGRDESLGRDVAVKVLLLEGEGPRRRFEREAEVTASLQARHVVRVFASGFFRGYPYIVYELIEGGRTLMEAFATEGPERRLDLLEEVAQGLASAHAQGVVHRDLKPENVLVRPTGEAVVLDFGLAGVARSSLTRTGEVMGTPAYMAPEQLRGQEATPACDVWALGLLLYEALYLDHPFLIGHTSLPLLMCRIVEAQVDFPPGAPVALRALIERCVVPEAGRRPADAGAFLEELRAGRRAPEVGRSRALTILGALVVCLVGALGAWLILAETQAAATSRVTPGPSAPVAESPASESPTGSPTPLSTATPTPSPTLSPPDESAEALFQRGWALVTGDEPLDYEGGLKLINEAGRRGHPEAIYQIARYQLESGAEGGQAKAEALFRRAAALGHSGAMWRLGIIADDDPEAGTQGEALEWYRRAADRGHLNAMHTYGLTLISGVHGKKEPRLGMAYLERAAERGYAPAKFQFGIRLISGDHGPADPPRALRLIEEAVASGDSLSQYLYGRWLLNGQWVPQDVERGQKLIRASAAQGDPDAIKFLEETGQR